MHDDVPGPGGACLTAHDRPRRGFDLTLTAWRMLRRDRTMLTIGLATALAGVLSTVLVMVLGGYTDAPQPSRTHLLLVVLLADWPLAFIGVFFSVALAAAADGALRGRRLTVRDALAVAVGRLGKIIGWSFFAGGVGALLAQLARRIPSYGRGASWLLGATWTLLSVLVVPVVTIENRGPVNSVRRSTILLERRWGHGITGSLAITAWMGFVVIPSAVLIAAGVIVLSSAPTAGALLAGAGVLVLMLVGSVAGTLRALFAVALYRYAYDGEVADGFAEADLEAPFR